MLDTPSSWAGGLLDSLPLAIVVLDADATVVNWNAAAEVLYGRRAADVLGASALDILFDADDRGGASGILKMASAGEAWEGDRRVRRDDGALLVSSFLAVPIGRSGGVAWIATDGMDQGLAEQERSVLLSAEHAARAEAEEALGLVEAIITSAPVGIAVFDLDLTYVRVNDAYAALSGIPAADHVGGGLGELVPLPPEVGADLRRVVTTGRAILGRHIELDPTATGHAGRHFDVSYFPVRTTTGILVGAGATVVEVTDAKRAEAERAVLLERAEDAQRRLAILATASTVLATTMELDQMLGRLARTLTPGAADWCVIQLLDAGGAIEHVAVSHRDRNAAEELAGLIRTNPVANHPASAVAEGLHGGQARLISPSAIGEAIRQAAMDRGKPEMAGRFDLRSSVVVPIEARGQMLGILLLSTADERVLGDDDLDLAVEIAHRAALAVSNAKAFQHEHQVAETLQRALLPASVPTVAGLGIAVRYVAATDGVSVGGDWYDVISFHDGTVGLIVGDVVGHDVAASTSMGQLRSALRAYASEDHLDPGATLARLDRVFDALGLTYASCVFCVVDPERRTMRWSNAGHPPPLLIRDGRASFLRDGAGVLLGVTAGQDAGDATTELREGDVLVLYTDGLIERRNEALSDGMARLTAVASELPHDDPHSLCDGLLAALLPAGATRDDDVAMLVVRVQPEDTWIGTYRLELEPQPETAAVARGFTAGVLEGAGRREHIDTAVLLVSELVTNAIRHSRPPCTLSITLRADQIEIAVDDAGAELPVVRPDNDLAEAGRGLLLVDALAADWGIRQRPGGKTTWSIVGSGGLSRTDP